MGSCEPNSSLIKTAFWFFESLIPYLRIQKKCQASQKEMFRIILVIIFQLGFQPSFDIFY